MSGYGFLNCASGLPIFFLPGLINKCNVSHGVVNSNALIDRIRMFNAVRLHACLSRAYRFNNGNAGMFRQHRNTHVGKQVINQGG